MAEKERLDELYRQGFVHEEEESELASGAQQQGTPSSSPVLGESAPDDEADSESDEERENHEGQTAPAVKFHSALEFLEQVKRNFAQEHGVYEEFLGIMKDFKQQSVDTPGVVARVRKLFQGYPELLQGFSMFLPPGFRNDQEVHSTAPQTVALQQQLAVSPATVPVPQSEAEPNNLPEIEQARNYVRKVKVQQPLFLLPTKNCSPVSTTSPKSTSSFWRYCTPTTQSTTQWRTCTVAWCASLQGTPTW
eukprot:TRINITY_DN4688_c0_g1_i4.p1 TRINITY_DN4688_c0_g1~~TRINITY_DN4688_c0_g1_i4.p1  ORF type:complete len:249 (-),score=61.02 TRINITY_DN4688_c0_g1_i4:108-854(-)